MGKINSATVSDFMDSLGTIYEACGYINDAGGCDRCPIKHNCLDDTSVAEFANFVTKGSLKEMLDLAEDIENFGNEQDMADYFEEYEAQLGKELDTEWVDLIR